MGVVVWMIKIIVLWGCIIGYFNQGGKELDFYFMWSLEFEYVKLFKQIEDFELLEFLVYILENFYLYEIDNMVNQFLFLYILVQ